MLLDSRSSHPSLPLDASPAFSTLSHSTFTSDTTLLPPSPHPNIRPTVSDSAVAQLKREREAECGPVAVEEEPEESRLERRLQKMMLSGQESPADCECGSPTGPASPEFEGGRFEALGGMAREGAREEEEQKYSPRLRNRAERPLGQRRASVSNAENGGKAEFDRFSIPSPDAIKGELILESPTRLRATPRN